MWIGVSWTGLWVSMWITHVGGKFRHGLLEHAKRTNRANSMHVQFPPSMSSQSHDLTILDSNRLTPRWSPGGLKGSWKRVSVLHTFPEPQAPQRPKSPTECLKRTSQSKTWHAGPFFEPFWQHVGAKMSPWRAEAQKPICSSQRAQTAKTLVRARCGGFPLIPDRAPKSVNLRKKVCKKHGFTQF